jgi:hypothetical protein
VKYIYSGPSSGGEADENMRIKKILKGRKRNSLPRWPVGKRRAIFFLRGSLSFFLSLGEQRKDNNNKNHALFIMLRLHQKLNGRFSGEACKKK